MLTLRHAKSKNSQLKGEARQSRSTIDMKQDSDSRCRGQPILVTGRRRPRRRLWRDDFRGWSNSCDQIAGPKNGERLCDAEDALGRSRSPGRLDQRRHAEHPDGAPRTVRRPRRADRRGVRGARQARSAGARTQQEGGGRVPRRRRLEDVPPDVARDRAGRRPHSADHARSAAPWRCARRRAATPVVVGGSQPVRSAASRAASWDRPCR